MGEVSNVGPNTQRVMQNDSGTYTVSKNPIIDAGVWGVIGAAGGALTGAYFENKLLKNKDLLNSRIKELEADVLEKTKPEKTLEAAKKALSSYKAGKMHIPNIRNLAIFMGVLSFLPSLLINGIIWGARKAHSGQKS